MAKSNDLEDQEKSNNWAKSKSSLSKIRDECLEAEAGLSTSEGNSAEAHSKPYKRKRNDSYPPTMRSLQPEGFPHPLDIPGVFRVGW